MTDVLSVGLWFRDISFTVTTTLSFNDADANVSSSYLFSNSKICQRTYYAIRTQWYLSRNVCSAWHQSDRRTSLKVRSTWQQKDVLLPGNYMECGIPCQLNTWGSDQDDVRRNWLTLLAGWMRHNQCCSTFVVSQMKMQGQQKAAKKLDSMRRMRNIFGCACQQSCYCCWSKIVPKEDVEVNNKFFFFCLKYYHPTS